MTTASTWAARALLARRRATIGPHSPTFYDEPLHLASGSGMWLRGIDGVDYLDAYNNVPHVGHGNPRVVEAIARQAATLNVNTRYLHDAVVDYAEALLATATPHLDRVLFTNSGSESNDLALRIARQHTGDIGILVTDFSYHGNTAVLAEATTGLRVKEPFGTHVRALRIPDLDADPRPEQVVVDEAVAEAQRAVTSLVEAGHGVSALLLDPLFSTEGLLRPPSAYVEKLAHIVRSAGGLVIADEVQSGLGRAGSHLWGHERFAIDPELVTLGKPLGNGHPVGGVLTTAALLDEFGRANHYFNTFAGNPVSAAAGLAVLAEMVDRELQRSALEVGRHARELLDKVAATQPRVRAVRGTGLFFGLEFADEAGAPDPGLTKWVIEDMRRKGVLISRIGPHGNVLKIRPPLVFERDHVDTLVDRLSQSLDDAAVALSGRGSAPAGAATSARFSGGRSGTSQP